MTRGRVSPGADPPAPGERVRGHVMERRADNGERAALLVDLFGQQLPSGARERLLRTSDVALLFQVSERTVSEWARRGRVPSVRTPGGHRRYPAEQIRQLFVDGRRDLATMD
jgi:excisionase family DNA binding protein